MCSDFSLNTIGKNVRTHDVFSIQRESGNDTTKYSEKATSSPNKQKIHENKCDFVLRLINYSILLAFVCSALYSIVYCNKG